MSFEIIKPGALSTVQDMGRFRVMKDGFGQSGAMDLHSMQIANRLVGNYKYCAVIEMTMLGIAVRFNSDYIIAVSGGNFSPEINGQSIRNNKAYKVKAGDVLETSSAKSGVRCYLAVSGGIKVPWVMNSRSTNLKSGLGGFNGRKLMIGDMLETDCHNMTIDDVSKCEIYEDNYENEITVRAVSGPQDSMFTPDDIRVFFTQEYTVTHQCDRMGVRLEGDALKGKNGMDIISDGIVSGSVQISANGQPIILTADHQTTGGYAKIATVISADLPKLAQVRAGDKIRFRQVSIRQAESAAKKEKKFIDSLFFF